MAAWLAVRAVGLSGLSNGEPGTVEVNVPSLRSMSSVDCRLGSKCC